MCGIIGYVGNKNAKDVIISGLYALEYRGYDSSGIAYNTHNKIKIVKMEGKVANLEKELSNHVVSSILRRSAGIPFLITTLIRSYITENYSYNFIKNIFQHIRNFIHSFRIPFISNI